MISTRKSPDAEEVKFSAAHILFVEGESEESIDPCVLGRLLDDNITVVPLGPSTHIRSAAQSLHRYHSTYYFLIDRDHFNDEFVEQCWNDFPNPEKYNLLIWRYRELENYFLEPEYLGRSRHLTISQEQLKEEILRVVNQRLLMEISNLVIISLREDLKKKWIEIFTNPDEFRDKDESIRILTEKIHSTDFAAKVSKHLKEHAIQSRFEEFYRKITNNADSVTFENRDWLKYVKGKKVLKTIIGSPSIFVVKDRRGNTITGNRKLNIIVEELVMNDEIPQPKDFIALKAIIEDKIS